LAVLVNVIRDVFETGHFYFGLLTPEFFEMVLNSPEVKSAVIEGDDLSKRERQIVRLICQGKSNGEMSLELSFSQRTIENHRQRISKKTSCRTTEELVIFAIRNGIYEI
jgi:DNA-binding NarL/FixJ family response regulator